MSVKPEHIDLNSDVVWLDRDNEVHGFNSLGPIPSDDRCRTEILSDPSSARGHVAEGDDNLGDFQGPTGRVDLISVSGVMGSTKSESIVVEEKMESVDKGIDVEAETGSVDRIDVKAYGFNVKGESLVVGEVELNLKRHAPSVFERDDKEVTIVQVVETATTTLGKANVEEGLKEGTCHAINPCAVSGELVQLENDGALGSRPPDLDVLVATTGGSLPSKESDVCHHGSDYTNIDVVENPEIETEVETQKIGFHVSEAGISRSYENISNELKLVVDLDPYVRLSENMPGDVSVKSVVSKPEFSVSDLVWGKVRSHPWWPGQILDPLASSEKAKKYFKKDSYLIAYFGDQTFAWNEPSRIKPFRAHFVRMEKQSSLEDFHYAVDCALDEVSRRVEFGLACSCVPDDVYDKVKTQIIINAGIREELSRQASGDRFSSADSFKPLKLVEYIKTLACLPCYSMVNRLELVTSQAQLLAYHRWKGYSHLPEFQVLGELLENEAEFSHSREINCCKLTENAGADLEVGEQVLSEKGKSMGQGGSSRKRRHCSGDSIFPSKKEKSLSELISERCLSNGKSGLNSKAGSKLISSSSGKKRKADQPMLDDSVKHKKSHILTECANESPPLKSLEVKQAFRVGASILRVASQLNGSSPLLKRCDNSSQSSAIKNKSEEKSLLGKMKCKGLLPTENFSLDDMFLQLCLAARNPMKKCSFLPSVVGFFSDFRNSVSLEFSSTRKLEQSPEQVSDGIVEESTRLEGTKTSELGYVKDSYWTGRVIQCHPGEEVSLENNATAELVSETLGGKGIQWDESKSIVHQNANLDSEQQAVGGNLQSDATDSVGYSDKTHEEDICEDDISPTALILNFTDLDSVPSETNLNKIFSHYGSLYESETEVLKKSSRAKVVFRKREDAETAFSRAGKYSIFGPSLVSYRLKYMPSRPSKSSPSTKKRSKKDVLSVD